MHCCVFMGEKKIWIQLDYEKFPPREKSSWFTEYRQMFHFLKVICPNFVQTGIPPEVYDEINKIRNKLKCLGDYRSCTISGRTSVVLQLVSNLYFLSIDKKMESFVHNNVVRSATGRRKKLLISSNAMHFSFAKFPWTFLNCFKV